MYDDFSKIYDRFHKIDYGAFVEFYKAIFRRAGVNPETVLDLGCGSGAVTLLLAKEGFDVIGVDISPDMLAIARSKAEEEGLDILFLNMDMCAFEIPEPVDCVVSALDCVNYLENSDELRAAFECVYGSLKPGGMFIFDINSEYKLREILGNNTFIYEDASAYCVWDCGYFPDDNVVSFDLNFFVKDRGSGYSRYNEYQEETIFKAGEVAELLKYCGFEHIEFFGDLGFEKPTDNTERIFFAARKM